MPGTPFEGIEGDLDLSPRRAEWARRHIGPDAQDDARDSLRQSLSTPSLGVVARCEGSCLGDLEGQRHMDRGVLRRGRAVTSEA